MWLRVVDSILSHQTSLLVSKWIIYRSLIILQDTMDIYTVKSDLKQKTSRAEPSSANKISDISCQSPVDALAKVKEPQFKNDKAYSEKIKDSGSETGFSRIQLFNNVPCEANGMRSMTKHAVSVISNKFKESLLMQGLSGILIPCLAIAISAITISWPQHNIILYPDYWYEPLGQLIFIHNSIGVAMSLMDCFVVMKADVVRSWKSFCRIYLSIALGFVVPYVSIHIVWVYLLEYRHPMPFIGQVCFVIGHISKTVSFWFLFPSSLRIQDKKFRKRLIAYLSLFPLGTVMVVGYNELSFLFLKIPPDKQWCLGALLPFVKKFNMWWNTKIAFVAAGGPHLSARLAIICWVGSMHSLSLVLLLGSQVTSTTAYLLMFLDSIPNVVSLLNIMKLERKRTSTAKIQRNEALQCLVLKELFEVLIPVVYCASFVVAFHSPNAEILGNIKNDYWQYEKVEKLSSKLNKVAIFFTVDALRGLIFGIILWIFSRLNVYKVYCELIYSYGLLISLYITTCLTGVFYVLLSFFILSKIFKHIFIIMCLYTLYIRMN